MTVNPVNGTPGKSSANAVETPNGNQPTRKPNCARTGRSEKSGCGTLRRRRSSFARTSSGVTSSWSERQTRPTRSRRQQTHHRSTRTDLHVRLGGVVAPELNSIHAPADEHALEIAHVEAVEELLHHRALRTGCPLSRGTAVGGRGPIPPAAGQSPSASPRECSPIVCEAHCADGPTRTR